MITDLDQAYSELPPPWDHQAEDIQFLLRGSYALYWEPRLGKTRECGEALRILAAERVVDSVIILCPVNAKHVWGHHLDLFLPLWPIFYCEGLKGETIPPESRAVILNPAVLISHSGDIRKFAGWHLELLRWMKTRRTVLIEDESDEFLINPVSKVYKAARSIGRVAERVWQLSGTPMEKSGLDIHWQMCHIGPRYPYFWASRDQFGKRFCEVIYNPWRGPQVNKRRRDGSSYQAASGGNDYGLLRDPDGLWRDLMGVADRRLRKDCLDVPKTRRLDVWVGERRQVGRPGDWAKFRMDLVGDKVDYTVNYCRELLEANQGPIVVGGWFHNFTEAVARRLKAPLVKGGTSAKERAQIYNDFQAGKLDVIVGNLKAMGRAAELSRAHHAVIGDLHWGARDNRQFEDRLAGSKQTKDVLIHYLLVRHSVDEEIWDRVLLKGRGMDDLDEAARRLRQIEAMGASLAELEDVS